MIMSTNNYPWINSNECRWGYSSFIYILNLQKWSLPFNVHKQSVRSVVDETVEWLLTFNKVVWSSQVHDWIPAGASLHILRITI